MVQKTTITGAAGGQSVTSTAPTTPKPTTTNTHADASTMGGWGTPQVGLLGMARDLQKDLDQMADKADTSTDAGLHYLLTECVLALLRNPQYWVYASSASASERSPEAAEQVHTYSLAHTHKDTHTYTLALLLVRIGLGS
jgi:uncharacterized membrane protein